MDLKEHHDGATPGLGKLVHPSPRGSTGSAERRRLRGRLPEGSGPRRLVGFSAGMYYAALRPEEAVAVALPDCRLPRTGWGRLIVHCTLPHVSNGWTATGRLRGEFGLKNRPL
ncbi:hypothetical protein AB5L52_14550 [Streptomyces sp. CG4]|uniref:hypothetical protein n=1 Tax=Streptomyces sp. CG4 TaxID=408783 RepID=UPI0034E2D6F9